MLLFILFFVFVILGVFAFLSGLPTLGFICFLPIVYLVFYGIAWLTITLSDKRWAAVCQMHNLPARSKQLERNCGNRWNRKFQSVIEEAMKTTSASDKFNDLQDCLRTVQNISEFDDIRNAFRYTGCQIRIEDANGNTISNII